MSFLRGSLIPDDYLTTAQTHCNKPLVVDGVVAGRTVRVLNTETALWDLNTHSALGRITQRQIASLQTGDLGGRLNALFRPEAVPTASQKSNQPRLPHRQQQPSRAPVPKAGGELGGDHGAGVEAMQANINAVPAPGEAG